MKRARLVWTPQQIQWLREEIEIRRWYAQVTAHQLDRKAMYEYEVTMLRAVYVNIDALLYPPEIAIWTWWTYWWSACWISMLADRENADGICFRRWIVDQRNRRLAALPPRGRGEKPRPTYVIATEASPLASPKVSS
jgi:hypothetical protein